MRKLLYMAVAAAALAAVSCTPLDRTNPTDPAADNYVGMHYMGTIGDFDQLGDFTFHNGTLWAAGRVKINSSVLDGLATYYSDGTLNYVYSATTMSSMTGIASNGTYLYVLCTNPGTAAYNPTDLQKYDPATMPVTSTAQPVQPPDYYGEYRFKCAASPDGNYLYLTGANNVMVFDAAANSTAAAASFGSSGTGDGQFSSISDIEVHEGGNIVVADSGLNRISVFSASGVFLWKIETTFAFSGIGLEGNNIYIPATDGIHKLSYETGAELLLFADYGEGNGKVTQAGPCEAYGGKVYAGTASSIRVFGP